jgi:hypothetical protein
MASVCNTNAAPPRNTVIREINKDSPFYVAAVLNGLIIAVIGGYHLYNFVV